MAKLLAPGLHEAVLDAGTTASSTITNAAAGGALVQPLQSLIGVMEGDSIRSF